jgi:hypothetical protein
MTDERDPFLANEIGRLGPPDHRPRFWIELEDNLASAGKTGTPLEQRAWSSPRFLGMAAALLVVAGVVAGLLIARSGDDATELDTGPANSATTPPTDGGAPGPNPTGTSDATGTTADPDAETARTTAEAAPDLSGAVELGPSLDGSLQLYAVPDPDVPGCEGQPTWRLYWIDGAGSTGASGNPGQLASSTSLSSVPTMIRGQDGRTAFLDRCEESTALYLATEAPSGTLSPLERLRPMGFENSVIHEVSWANDPDSLFLRVTRLGPGETGQFRIEVDVTGQVLGSERLDSGDGGSAPGTCSAQDLTDPVIAGGGQPWSGLAADIQQAALDCDYDRLAELASPDIVYSFGGGDDFAGNLRTAEASGDDVTQKLVLLLGAEPGQRTEPAQLEWPAFFVCEPTCGMDTGEVRRLGYTDAEIADFQAFGGYFGYRVGFAQDSDGTLTWTFFVAGD